MPTGLSRTSTQASTSGIGRSIQDLFSEYQSASARRYSRSYTVTIATEDSLTPSLLQQALVVLRVLEIEIARRTYIILLL